MIYSGTAIFNEYRDRLVYGPQRDTTDYNERFFSCPDTRAMFRLSSEIFSVFYSFSLGESIEELAKDAAYHEILQWLFLFFEKGLTTFVPP